MLNFDYKYFQYLTIYLNLCGTVLGLAPYTLKPSKTRFGPSKILQYYTVVVGCIIVVCHYRTTFKLLPNIDRNLKQIFPIQFVNMFELMEFTNLIVNYLTVLMLNREIIEAHNKMISCNHELLGCGRNKYTNLSFKYFLIFAFKEVLLKWVIFVTNVVSLRIISNNRLTYIDGILNRLAHIITYLVSSHFIANLMNSIHLYDIINGELIGIMKELKKYPIRIGRILEMCDILDRLCNLHDKVTRSFKRNVKVFSLSMLMQISFLFVNIVSFANIGYSLLMQNLSKRLPLEIMIALAICGTVNVGLSLVQLFSYTILSSRVVQNSRKAGQLLYSVSRICTFDERLVSAVESFSLSLEQNKFEISICGLFVVNYELMYAMAASMTSYLIILVQYQLEFSKSA